MLFVWNGKQASATIKSQTLTKGYALDKYLDEAKDSGLNVLFSGGVVKNKKLQRGNIFEFQDVLDKSKKSASKSKSPPPNPSTSQIIQTYETVYLLKWLFPETSQKAYQQKIKETKGSTFPKFKEHFVTQKASGSYWDRF